MKYRLFFISGIFFIAWIGLVFRAIWLQVLPNERLSQLKTQQFQRQIAVESRRGEIFDRNGYELAISSKAHSVFADPSLIENPTTTARKLASILKLSAREIEKKLRRTNRFVWIERSVNEATYQQLKNLQIKGLGFILEPKRYYPQKQILAATLGFVGRDGTGLDGIEYSFDSVLRGEKKKIFAGRDARGRTLLKDLSDLVGVEDGKDLRLTIDLELQVVLEEELRKSVERLDAEKAIAVVLNPKTFEVLAMGQWPGFDANYPHRTSSVNRRNFAIAENFEPGSTIKTLLIAGAIEQNDFLPNTIIDCEGGRARVGNRWVREADRSHQFKQLSLSEILALSSNVGVAKVAQELGDKKVFEIYQRFGLGQKTNLGLSSEQAGFLPPLPWKSADLSSRSFGHSLSTTALQMAAAYASIANGGLLSHPRLVLARSDQRGGWEEFEQQAPIKRILSESTAATMKLMLMQATSREGTGYRAQVPGFLVAGKTGTAQKVDLKSGGYIKGAYISSFAGFAPAHDPEFVVYVAVDHPKKEVYGSQTAAPIFASIMQYALRRAGLSPMVIGQEHLIDQQSIQIQKRQRTALRGLKTKNLSHGSKEVMPHLLGLSAREALKELAQLPQPVEIKGEGWLIRSFPGPGDLLDESDTIRLEFASSQDF